LGSIDQLSLFDLAIQLLHTARHARHCFGARFEELDPLEDEAIHEVATWKHTLTLLQAWGGEVWRNAVTQECAALTSQHGLRNVVPSGAHHNLDSMFGLPPHAYATTTRNYLVAMGAHFRRTEETKYASLPAACTAIVGAPDTWSAEVA